MPCVMYMCRETEINQMSSFHLDDKLLATASVGPGGFCNRYNNDRYAVGIYTGIAPLV